MTVQSTRRIENYQFSITANAHVLQTDVPKSLGGGDSAPDPHDYLLSSLAACTVITLQMYANRKGIPLQSSDVKIKITSEGELNEIHREIDLIGDLTEDQRQSLMAIADKCPIHRFLTKGAKITTQATARN